MSDENPKNKLVRSDEWQKVRQSLLGKWMKEPEWCCTQLKKYLGALNKTDNDRIRVVMNYLTGTGFRTGKIKPPCAVSLRQQLSSEITKRKAQKSW